MRLTYKTRRTLQHVATAALAVLLILILFWFCWNIWVERYVVYTRDGATLDFSRSPLTTPGVLAVPAETDETVSIFFNEGSDAVELNKELTALNGYYIDYEALKGDMESIKEDLNRLKAGVPIMIELKGGYGSFYYTSSLTGAVSSASVNVAAVDELIQYVRSKGFYMIAKISAFRDYDFGVRNVTSGLYTKSRIGLWMDSGGCYWLDPTSANTLGWVTSIINEVKALGFNEVVLDNFRFPAETDKYIFTGNMDEALGAAATTLMASCGTDTFVVSFCTATAAFPLPEGRSRLYLSDVQAQDVGARAAEATFENPEVRLVFLSGTNDTRFDAYGVLRPLSVSEGLEAQKADMAASQETTG